MKKSVEKIYYDLFERYPSLSGIKEDVLLVFECIKDAYINGGKLLVCGNGGSAADSVHIVGELMKGFMLKRELPENEKEKFINKEIPEGLQGALPAISLVSETALISAFCNDCSPELVFAQQVYGLMNENDTLLCLSTSGNSKNVVYAAQTAKAKGGKAVAIVGETGGKLSETADACVRLPSTVTPEIQEYTVPVYHTICAMLEAHFFNE
ncbi:MAG: SIS domain-containing protein [Acutalibacteraceae bacterium]